MYTYIYIYICVHTCDAALRIAAPYDDATTRQGATGNSQRGLCVIIVQLLLFVNSLC